MKHGGSSGWVELQSHETWGYLVGISAVWGLAPLSSIWCSNSATTLAGGIAFQPHRTLPVTQSRGPYTQGFYLSVAFSPPLGLVATRFGSRHPPLYVLLAARRTLETRTLHAARPAPHAGPPHIVYCMLHTCAFPNLPPACCTCLLLRRVQRHCQYAYVPTEQDLACPHATTVCIYVAKSAHVMPYCLPKYWDPVHQYLKADISAAFRKKAKAKLQSVAIKENGTLCFKSMADSLESMSKQSLGTSISLGAQPLMTSQFGSPVMRVWINHPSAKGEGDAESSEIFSSAPNTPTRHPVFGPSIAFEQLDPLFLADGEDEDGTFGESTRQRAERKSNLDKAKQVLNYMDSKLSFACPRACGEHDADHQ
ncbi:hypothetical protein GGX14DRAFT_395519 [Mycena pura]|uniref:Uncharacterized protein n=1 Tax=Mycena pura TaxID=153505 RepID=A0AAD6YCE4_9AGAR|nr:hypothetical protein GGX14DRAFT_395519 [Mycena pura]